MDLYSRLVVLTLAGGGVVLYPRMVVLTVVVNGWYWLVPLRHQGCSPPENTPERLVLSTTMHLKIAAIRAPETPTRMATSVR